MIGSHGRAGLDGNGVAQHPLPHAWAQTALRDNADTALEQILQIHQQAAEIEQTPTRRHLDEEVDVARFVSVTPCN